MQTTEMANSDLDKYYKALDRSVVPCLRRSTLLTSSSDIFDSFFSYFAYNC